MTDGSPAHGSTGLQLSIVVAALVFVASSVGGQSSKALADEPIDRAFARFFDAVTFDEMIAATDAIATSGIAFDDGEFNLEVRCVAVALKDFRGETIGALGISGPVWRLTIQALQSRAKILQAAADRLSGELGATSAA